MRAGGLRAESLDATQYGLHYGIVCQNKDPDNLDRIKVRLPWLDAGDTDQTHWAQLLTPMEGNKFGWYVLPDIDDVVVVMFIGGDSSQPVVVGGVWSKPDFSPETNEDGANNFRGYRSRVGHRMVFDDSKGGTKVWFADKTTKLMVGIGKFAKDGAGPNICAVWKPPMSGDNGISISSMEGKMEITAKTKLTIQGENIKINAKTTIDIKAGSDFQMEGSSSAKLTSSSESNYDAPKIDIE
ncbi:MAG TPA: phage baseplate assembly protein V [Kofleriaceae bacterium]|nr:phage baseplate assembly protein V [Kofleriaceae bacterium]